MLRSLGKIPVDVTVACSGGPDSMAILDFLMKGKKNVQVAYFDHDTPFGRHSAEWIHDFCSRHKLNLLMGKIDRDKRTDESPEEFWRNERYKFLNEINSHVITGHHLDDAVEWWLFTAFHGKPRLIPTQNKNVIRPFLITSKDDIWDWIKRKNVPHLIDPTNQDRKYARNRIRHEIIGEVLKINPGIRKTIKKKLLQQFGDPIYKVDEIANVSRCLSSNSIRV
jgi:tRNA(Ile)-lysidine synthase